MGLSVCGAALSKGTGNVRFPGTSPPSEGTYEPQVLGLSPNIYLKFGGDLSDSSGNGRNGTLVGSGGTYVTALAANIGTGNTAFDTDGTASISVAHAAADVALTFASNWASTQTTDGTRFIADTTISCWFKINALPTGSDKAVIFAKSHADAIGEANSYVESHPISASSGSTVNGGSFAAYFDANGAVHIDVRSFRGRPCTIRTVDGAVTTATTYHLVVQLSYDGVTAWLDGAKFEDGYANPLHVFGLAANIRNITFANDYAWTIGKAAWGGQADIIVDEFCVFNRAPSATISQSNVNTLAQEGSTPAALPHYIWGRLTVNESSYANIQAAVDDVNSSGGGTVLISAGTYNENVQLGSNTRIKGTGGTVTINGVISTATPSVANLGVGTGDFLTNDRDIAVSNTRSVGDIAVVRGITNGVGGAATALRHDRRWNSSSESNDADISDGELFRIESRTASDLTFEGIGCSYDITAANREEILAFTPTSWIAVEDITVNRASGHCFDIVYASHGRFVNITATNAGDYTFQNGFYGLYLTHRNITLNNPSGTSSAMGLNSCKDCVTVDYSCTNNARHAWDIASNANFVPSLRCELHGLTETSGEVSATPNEAKYGTHGMSTDCIHWKIDCDWGGYGVTGWKHDTRWTRQGLNGEGRGALIINDGAGDCYYRDGLHISPVNWFRAFEGTVGVDRCHFENIEWTGTTPTTTHSALSYGTGADVNTYTNVDTPSASWTEV